MIIKHTGKTLSKVRDTSEVQEPVEGSEVASALGAEVQDTVDMSKALEDAKAEFCAVDIQRDFSQARIDFLARTVNLLLVLVVLGVILTGVLMGVGLHFRYEEQTAGLRAQVAEQTATLERIHGDAQDAVSEACSCTCGTLRWVISHE